MSNEEGLPSSAVSSTPEQDASDIVRLTSLSPLAYEREREAAAKHLGIRVSMLDRLVQAERNSQRFDMDQDNALQLPSPDPWPEMVDGADLLTCLSAAIRRYVVMADGAPEAVALWVLHAHALDAFAFSPRLAITSAEKRSGKTTLLDVLGCLVPRPLPTANATAPAIFRTIELLAPTLLIDEADTFLRRNDELRGVLNSGHRRATARVLRLDGEDYTPHCFGTWAATAIAMIGRLPDTLADRSIEIRLRRRLPSEAVTRFRADWANGLAQLARMAARWAADHLATLRVADPQCPASLNDRAADNWSPLLAIADQAGGEWPERARQAIAYVSLRTDDTDGTSVREMLLADIRATFVPIEQGIIKIVMPTGEQITDTDRIRSFDLARHLTRIEGHPWAEWGAKHQPLSNHALARQLRPLAIAPATLRFHKKDKDGKVTSITDKGYLRCQFDDAFARYLPPVTSPDRAVTASQSPEI